MNRKGVTVEARKGYVVPVAEAPAQTPEPLPEHGGGPPCWRILLVEDHEDTADAMAELLRARGHRVTVARDLAQARAAALASAGEIDLVVSDLGLPDGSGHELMRELAGRYGLRGIALSGYGMEEDLRKSRESGFARHLTKPVSPQALEAAIQQVAPGSK